MLEDCRGIGIRGRGEESRQWIMEEVLDLGASGSPAIQDLEALRFPLAVDEQMPTPDPPSSCACEYEFSINVCDLN